ncbi:hypothetical protein GCM10009557_83430 [Virgisporangium ochraceum]|uniref:PBS lyase HEAT domain protein repeat-containing protein n=1 Tax=Virgisporangium ochraceum TaxID=65505 RepID=A0A8J4A3V3_9ACTN|nr:hypothetical protein [Virgisporangium ochraceum]GIJ75374.1 hypothetical protein Voc01_102910 [Virgisporangium ochraceum]
MELDDVDWAALHGTYGSAADVPHHLEALRSTDRDARRTALVGLSDAVVHQGTRWQVSAHVVPFLVRLVDDPTTADRGALTALLRDVGIGPRDDGDLPFDPDAAFDGPTVTGEQEALVIERVYRREEEEEELTDDWVDLADACAEKWDADAYRAAATHADAYRRWLSDRDPEVASRAAELLHHGSFPVRLTAAVALAYRVGRGVPDDALTVLVEAREHEELPPFPWGWDRRAPRRYIALALQRIGLG